MKNAIIIITTCLFVIALVLSMMVNTNLLAAEVKSYAFTATVTETHHSTAIHYINNAPIIVHTYTLTFVDGIETGTITISENVYHSVVIGDLIDVDARIMENLITHNEITYYTLAEK